MKEVPTKQDLEEAEKLDLSLVEAVEALSQIADLKFDQNVGVAQKHDVVLQDEKMTYRTVHWLHEERAQGTVELVKETYRVILNYLKRFYEEDYTLVTDQATMDRIKTIMVLVGEAAKKLDKYTALFHLTHPKSITRCKEYRDLQEFYFRKISRTIDEGVLGQWILALSKRVLEQKKRPVLGKRGDDVKRVFIDLEEVKKDTLYELFFIRKQDGTRFFSPRLIRNIKLVCDFGYYIGKGKEIDPIEDLVIVRDRITLQMANDLFQKCRHAITDFYRYSYHHKENELVQKVNSAIMALLLASHKENLYQGGDRKSCQEYYENFLTFIHEILLMREFERYVAFPPKRSEKSPCYVLNLVKVFCLHLFLGLKDHQMQSQFIQSLINMANENQSKEHLKNQPKLIWNTLARDHAALQRLLNRHPNGPLNLVLDLLEEGGYYVYNPILQKNMPRNMYTLAYNKKKIVVTRLPSPTQQAFIHKATVLDEFKMYLRALKDKSIRGKHLMINLQDRSSWKEYARCQTLEKLQEIPDFDRQLVVLTLAIDTEFYHQLSPYHEDHQAVQFLEHFNEQIGDESSGFFLPEVIKKKLPKNFFQQLLKKIHTVFFHKKNVLSREQRLDFISLFYLFLEIKCLEIVQPTSLSFTCKDALDTGQVFATELFIFFELFHEDNLTEAEYQLVSSMLFGPAIIHRERNILLDRFNRMLNLIRLLESKKGELGYHKFKSLIDKEFGSLFKTAIFNTTPILPYK